MSKNGPGAANPLIPTSFTPNPKLLMQKSMSFEQQFQNRMSQRKVGENFAGLQSYILSEIDSGGEECK